MENNTVEWKKCWDKEYLKFICGMANSKTGGTLYVGIDDDGKIVGVKDPKDTMKKISDTLVNTMRIYPDVCLDEDTNVITIAVFPSATPVELNGKYYIRVGNTNHEVRGKELDRFVMRRTGLSWTEITECRVELSDLDIESIMKFREMALECKRISPETVSKSDEELLRRLNLTYDGALKRSAALLFHLHPSELYTGASVKIAMFRESEILYMDEIDCPLILMPNKVMDVLESKYLIRPISYKGIQRLEIDPYPIDALREVILNGIMHSDYSAQIPIQIKVYEDRIIVSNIGGLPENWSLEDLMDEHLSVPSNPSLASVFFRAGAVESLGRGIERIMSSYSQTESKKPVFDIMPNSFRVTLYSMTYKKDETEILNISEKNDFSSIIGSKYAVLSLRVLNTLNERGPLSISDIADELLMNRSNLSTRSIRPLLQSGHIEMTNPESPNSKHQMYRITSKGFEQIR